MNEINFTLDPTNMVNSALPNDITPVCWNWCSEQAEAFIHNQEINGIFIIAISLIFMLIHLFFHYFKDFLLKSDLELKVYNKIYILSFEFAFLLNLGFIIWYLIR